jgi:DNA-binding CsgD family transcriptional regulator/tetratricopeptide (TPR) repeat protein
MARGRGEVLIERNDDLERVDALLQQVAAGTGAVLLVEGEPGIGKTALLTEVRGRADARGFAQLTARGGELESDLAFGVVRQLVEPRLRRARGSAATAAPAGRDDPVLAGAAALVAPAMGVAAPLVAGAASPGAGDEHSVDTVAHGFYWLCSNLTDDGPVVVSVDDAHWADVPSLRVLSHVARRLDDLAVLMVVTTRPPRAEAADYAQRLLAGVPYEWRRLEPLSDDGVGALVRRDLAADADAEFCRACAEASRGNPFLLREALAALHADGIAPRADQAARVAEIHPDTIARALLSRLARLGDDATALARAVAVLGPDAELRRAARMAGLDAERAADACDTLAADGIVAPAPAPSVLAEGLLEFVHPLVRTAVYGDTAPARRALAHKRAARLLHDEGADPAHVARHLVVAEPDDDPWVVEALREAARADLARGAPEPAVAFLQRARREPPEPAVLGELLFLLGTALARSNRHADAGAAFEAALARTPSPEAQVPIAVELAQLLTFAGLGGQAMALVDQVRDRIGDGHRDQVLLLEATAGFCALGGIQPTRDWIARVENVAGALPGDDEMERSLLAVLAFTGAVTGARTADEVVGLARRARPRPGDRRRSIDVNLSSSALAIADQLPESLDVLDEGIDLVRRRGDIFELVWLSVIRSHTAYYAGRLLDAEADGRTALALAADHPELTLLAVGVLIDALVERGLTDEADDVLRRHADQAGQPMSLLTVHFFHVACGHLRLAQGAPEAALDELLTCGAQLSEAGYANPSFALWRSTAAQAHLALGHRDEARSLADEELDLARRFGAPHAVGSALRARGLAEGGSAGLALLAEAVDVLRTSTAELERASALVDHGAALRRHGQRQQAQDTLRQGLDAASRIGAVALADRARDELVAAGARPRRAALTGPAALTASELRVARLAAEGRSNREIAQTLYVSRRTVEVHLTSTYRKLGITSRDGLATAL